MIELTTVVNVESLHSVDSYGVQLLDIRHNGHRVATVRVMVWPTDVSVYLEGPEGGKKGRAGYSIQKREPEFYAAIKQKQKEYYSDDSNQA